MGISGLLPVLKSITDTKTIDQYKGQTLAIDGYCWLHRAIYSCSQEICLGEETDKYIVYFIDRVNALLQHGVTPYVVFDGGPLPMKKGTEEERRKARAKNRELGIQSWRQKNYAEARKYFVRAADVSPYMAHRVIQRLKAMRVQFVVAPYEADAQLTFLIQHGLVDGVITEDSDCLPFGCEKVLFKMDRDGIAQEICASNLGRNAGLSFHMFTHEMFLEMCIFSGCDYLSSLPGFGLKKAYALIKQHGSYTKILRALRMEGKVRIPATYEEEFERAILTFRHQRVYDPSLKKLVPLTPIPQELLDKDAKMDFVGPIIPDATAQAIAEGDMDPISLELFNSHPSAQSDSPTAGSTVSTAATHANASGFIARKQPQQPPKSTVASQPQRAPNRSLPAWMSRKATQLAAATPSPPPSRSPSPAIASSPKTISHFFAAREKDRFSPTDEAQKSSGSALGVLSRQQSNESTYESQEPGEVDVTRNISFSPLDDEVKSMHEKENSAPTGTGAAAGAAPQNAFARMMCASGGSALKKHNLKRKAQLISSSSQRSGRLLGGVVGHHKSETPMERIKRLAFTKSLGASERSPATAPTATAGASQSAEPEAESDVVESQVEEESQPCVVRSAILGERLNTKTVARVDSPQKPRIQSKPVDAFARFRFGPK